MILIKAQLLNMCRALNGVDDVHILITMPSCNVFQFSSIATHNSDLQPTDLPTIAAMSAHSKRPGRINYLSRIQAKNV